MAIATFNKKQFEKEIGKLNEKMQEKIAMFGTPVEEITNEDIQVEIFPNRPDLISLNGFMRSFNTFLEKDKGIKKYEINGTEKNFNVQIDKFQEVRLSKDLFHNLEIVKTITQTPFLA